MKLRLPQSRWQRQLDAMLERDRIERDQMRGELLRAAEHGTFFRTAAAQAREGGVKPITEVMLVLELARLEQRIAALEEGTAA